MGRTTLLAVKNDSASLHASSHAFRYSIGHPGCGGGLASHIARRIPRRRAFSRSSSCRCFSVPSSRSIITSRVAYDRCISAFMFINSEANQSTTANPDDHPESSLRRFGFRIRLAGFADCRGSAARKRGHDVLRVQLVVFVCVEFFAVLHDGLDFFVERCEVARRHADGF